MRINISYYESLSFEQFKEQFEKHFALSNPARKEAEMKKSWENAEGRLKLKESKVAVKNEDKVTIKTSIPLNEDGTVVEDVKRKRL